jgi:hypothetical protein
VLTDFGVEASFSAAAERVREHYGFEVGASLVRSETLKHAGRAAHKLAARYGESFRTLPAQGRPALVCEADGTMLCTVNPAPRKAKRPRQWREMRLAAAQSPGEAKAVYAATFGDVAETGCRWGHCAKQAGWGLDTRIHVVGDGAEWLRTQSQEVFGTQGRFLLDFFHLSEYLAAAAEPCRPGDPQRWRRTQQARLKRGAPRLVLEVLAPHLEPASVPDELAPVRKANRYLAARLDCVAYPEALAANLPIGSGLIESGHRHVLQARLKGAGTAWLPETAQNLAQLRVLRANCEWDEFWERKAA